MKKIYSLSVIALSLLSGAVSAQSQRYQICEEFTQASCAPCAAQNPAFNTILNANETKIIGLKYQVWWPGYDPMYLQNTADVNARVAYYNVTGVPNARADGNAYAGAPSGVSQAFIDNRYNNVASPFTINLTHSFNADYTQMTINADITCTQAVSGTLVAQTAVMERQINFTSAPGSNGETVFYGVMKKMVPDASGTTLPTSWTVGQTQNLNFVVNIPWYVYNVNQLAAVVFIQDNATKAVQQAAYSAPLNNLPSVDMAITTVTGVPALICTGTFSPVVTLKNNGAATISSCDINYSIDNGPVVTAPWTGSLAQNQTTPVTINNISAGNGAHRINFFTTNLDAGIDIAPNNSNAFKNFAYSATQFAPPIVEGFTAATFPPTDWIVNDVNQDNYGWVRSTLAGGFGNTSQSAKMDFYNSPSGRVDELYIKKVDFSTLTGTAALTFNVAYAQYSTENDKIEVMVSTNCGTNWTTLFTKSGATLSTAPATTASFVPSATQWRAESVDLTSFVGTSDVLIKFKATSNYGNNAYLDDINIQVLTGIAENDLNQAVNVYPTIGSGVVNMDVNFTKEQNLKVSVLNALGQEVVTNAYGKTLGGKFTLDLSNQAAGTYNVKIYNDEAAVVKTVSVIK